MMIRWFWLRRSIDICKQPHCANSSAAIPAVSCTMANGDKPAADVKPTNDSENQLEELDATDKGHIIRSVKGQSRESRGIVAAAFAALKEPEAVYQLKKAKETLNDQIAAAKTVESLLGVADKAQVSRKQALKIVSTLAEWSSSGQVDQAQFELDTRFVGLCRLLGRSSNAGQAGSKPGSLAPYTDLNVVLGVTGDDEAAKLVSTITLPQMIKVFSSLAAKHRRSTPLLHSLAFNIGRTSEKLDIKQAADILYAMATLNFPDEVLLERVSSDLIACIAANQKSAVVGSIAKSLGIMRYKDTELLDSLCEWTEEHMSTCRTQDLVSVLLMLATLNHCPANSQALFKNMLAVLSPIDMPNMCAWLDIVWSLAVLNQATPQLVASVLDPVFVRRLADTTTDGISVTKKLKLMNINGVAKLKLKGYTGPLLEPDSPLGQLTASRTREKQALVNSVLDALSNLLPSAAYLRTNIDSGMGFIIDGECLVDAKMTPLQIVDKKTGIPINPPKAGIRIALLVLDYSDMTCGRTEPSGIAALPAELTRCLGYHVLSVPHTDYNARDKLVKRVQFLEQQLKSITRTT